jgi:hypothetical protein
LDGSPPEQATAGRFKAEKKDIDRHQLARILSRSSLDLGSDKGKKITLLSPMPNEFVQCDRGIFETAKHEYENQHDQTAPPSSSNAIKLKSHAMLATLSDLLVPPTIDAPFHALVWRKVLFSLHDITTPLPRAITKLLQEFKDVFPAKIPLGLPPLRGIEHQIDLIPRAMLPNRATYRTNSKRLRKFSNKSNSFWNIGIYEKALVLAQKT